MGLCMWLGLKFAGFVIAKFRKLRETNDNGWLRCRFGKWGSVGNAFVLLFESSYVLGFVDSFALYSLICASKRILFIDDENISKNPANNIRATLACRFTCVCIALFSNEKRNPIKLNLAYKIVNLSKM